MQSRFSDSKTYFFGHFGLIVYQNVREHAEEISSFKRGLKTACNHKSPGNRGNYLYFANLYFCILFLCIVKGCCFPSVRLMNTTALTPLLGIWHNAWPNA